MAKRAIIYIAWGEKWVREALVSARTAAFLGIDRILITREDSLEYLTDESPFAKIITHRFTLSGYLAKAELVHAVPGEYDSLLFLDTDTHVLMDIRFGFDQSERHGIAAVMAPDYSLENAHGQHFGRILTVMGIPHVNTMQYNTGVIFFSRRAEVWKIMEDWYNLCRTLSPQYKIDADQPYFTLALERYGFNPYTLSPSYNYRNFGEFVSGAVRIWHSHVAPPSDVNTFAWPWPPRSFRDSVRLEYHPAPNEVNRYYRFDDLARAK